MLIKNKYKKVTLNYNSALSKSQQYYLDGSDFAKRLVQAQEFHFQDLVSVGENMFGGTEPLQQGNAPGRIACGSTREGRYLGCAKVWTA